MNKTKSPTPGGQSGLGLSFPVCGMGHPPPQDHFTGNSGDPWKLLMWSGWGAVEIRPDMELGGLGSSSRQPQLAEGLGANLCALPPTSHLLSCKVGRKVS